MKALLPLIAWLFTLPAFAVTIEFPEEELAQESVLPIFDNTVAVKSRLVPTAGRLEIGLGSGLAMNEPFFESTRFGGHLAYHFNETHGIMITGQTYTQGLGPNGQTLSNTNLVTEGSGTSFIRMEYAPQSQYHFLANYQLTPYYGKMSLFKDFVMNLSTYAMFGGGVIDIGGVTTPALNIGVGQKFYFNKNWGIRADLGLMAYQGINYFVGSGGGSSPLEDSSSNPGFQAIDRVPGDFDTQMIYDMHMTISVIFMI